MTDRELLEFAAKAAGYDVRSDGEGGLTITVKRGLCREWSPLTDDGDALRLAVKLKMQVSITNESCRAETLPALGIRINNKDELAATRRAIVMAAANAGADMK